MDFKFSDFAENISLKEAKLLLLFFLLLVIILTIGLETFKSEDKTSSEDLRTQLDFNVEPTYDFKKISYSSYQQWDNLLNDYKVDEAGRLLEIPHLKIIEFPKDMGQIESIAKRKRIFFNIVAIGAYHPNHRLLKQRELLQKISNQYYLHGHLEEQSKEWLQEKFVLYNIKESGKWRDKIKSLEKRLDIIPLSLILAQAASESGWGTSRFTIQANNIFGEWTFNPDAPGIIPEQRPVNASYKIRKFSSIQGAINSYLLNLNTHPAYSQLRKIRFELREEGKELDSLKLSTGLLNYSQKREEYVEQINNIIKYNHLQEFDRLLRK
ncbi:MAG: glucosaminidase domain-containing protein [Halanaerobacter sp.]